MSYERRAIAAVGLAVVFALVCGAASAATSSAPDFTLKNVKGDEVSLSALLERGPVIVDFWATWCKPCIKAFPELQTMLDEYGKRGLTVAAISIDGPKSTSRVGAFIASKGYTFEVLLDPSQKVARKYHVNSVPRTVLVDTDGSVVYAVTGYRPSHIRELEEAVAGLLPRAQAESGSETPAEKAEVTGSAQEVDSE